jgi:small GTP-binding protein
MAGIEDQIQEIEAEILKTVYNKATSKHIGRLKAKLAKLKEDALNRALKAGGGGEGYAVKKSGDASVVLVGFPSTGKSTLLNQLTGAGSEVAAYEFTTLTVIPGAMEHKGAKIQVLDVPGLIAGAALGKGRGKEVIAVVRTADLIVLLSDVFNQQHVSVLLKELYDAGVRVNCERPDITIKKAAKGGIRLNAVGTLDLDIEEVRSILSESRIASADILIRGNATQDDLIDAMLGSRVYIPAVIAVNKVDLIETKEADAIERDLIERFNQLPIMISAATGYHMEELKDDIFDRLGFIRVYLKPQAGPADLEEPLIIRKNATVEDICSRLHRDFVHKFRYARIWGTSVKHEAQRVGISHVVHDRDIVQIIIER